jgi:protein-L-isoaspartate(D-aspartate) O-methyltransferase
MLEWLEVEPGDKVLDVGSGSGWTTALLSRLTGMRGRVIGVEKVPELAEFGRRNCDAMKIRNVTFYPAKKHIFGWPPEAPYDKILVSATARSVPHDLVRQLKAGGKMVIPIGSNIVEVEKDISGHIELIEHNGFAFVPLIK